MVWLAPVELKLEKMPLKVLEWLTPEPLLLLRVLYDTLIPHSSFTKIPVEGLVAAVAPPKFKIVFPVADEDPPTSFPVFAKL